MLDHVEVVLDLLTLRQDVAQGRAVLLLQTLEQREPVLHLLQACRRRLDAAAIRAKEVRELLELGLHGVPRGQVNREALIDGSEVAQTPPDDPEGRKRGGVPFIERLVGVG